MHAFGYKFSGYFMEYGPVQAASLDQARNLIRARLGVARLPRGLKVWDLGERPITTWVPRHSA